RAPQRVCSAGDPPVVCRPALFCAIANARGPQGGRAGRRDRARSRDAGLAQASAALPVHDAGGVRRPFAQGERGERGLSLRLALILTIREHAPLRPAPKLKRGAFPVTIRWLRRLPPLRRDIWLTRPTVTPRRES